MGVIEQAVFREGVSPTCPAVDEHAMHTGIDGERIEILRKCRCHRGAAGRSADDIESNAGFAKGAINSDVSRAVSTASARDEAQGVARQKSPEARYVVVVFECYVVVHRRLSEREPVTCALRDPAASVDDANLLAGGG